MAVCKPRREALEGATPADTLILDLQAPVCETVNLLLKPCSLWFFVTGLVTD